MNSPGAFVFILESINTAHFSKLRSRNSYKRLVIKKHTTLFRNQEVDEHEPKITSDSNIWVSTS